jgi:hypothetical protein
MNPSEARFRELLAAADAAWVAGDVVEWERLVPPGEHP